jgi:photosystem II stability/assembly factor-like uncharacterized protein
MFRSTLLLAIVALTLGLSPEAAAAGSSAPTHQTIREVWPVGPTTAWVWTQNDQSGWPQGLARTTDGGARWADATPSMLRNRRADRSITGSFALDAQHAWLVYGAITFDAPQSIMATEDGGRRWSVVGQVPARYGCNLEFVTPLIGWCVQIGAAAGSEGVTIYRTADGGVSWRLVSTEGPTGGSPGALPFGCDKEVSFVTATMGWSDFSCAGGVSPLYETSDAGTTWSRVAITPPTVARDGNGVESYESYESFSGPPVVSGERGAVGVTINSPGRRLTDVYQSTDGGTSWHVVVPPGPSQDWSVDIVTPNEWRLVSGRRILSTDDAGTQWRRITADVTLEPIENGALFPATAIDFVTTKVGWLVGKRLWRTTDGGSRWKSLRVPSA